MEATSGYLNRPARDLAGVRPPRSSPWGRIQDSAKLAEGVWKVSTASHGGIWLSPERAGLVPGYVVAASFLGRAEWWEEDCDQAWPRFIFRRTIGLYQGNQARTFLESYKPEVLARVIKELGG